MTLPSELTINYSGSPLEGIINLIKILYPDPIQSNIVIPNSTFENHPFSDLITWNPFSSNGPYENAFSWKISVSNALYHKRQRRILVSKEMGCIWL